MKKLILSTSKELKNRFYKRNRINELNKFDSLILKQDGYNVKIKTGKKLI